MSKKIKIIFEQEYKSFKRGSEYEFEGNLNILSGINGAGKSQLLQAIKDYATTVFIDDKILVKNSIVKYSFKDNISLPSFGTYDFNITRNYSSVCVDIFNNYINLCNNYNNAKKSSPTGYYQMLGISEDTNLEEYCFNNMNYSMSIRKNNSNISITKNISKKTIFEIINYVIEKHPNDYMSLSSSEIVDCIPSDIVFKFQDETVEGITNVFTEAARIRALQKMECGDNGTKFNNEEWLKTAPWTEINNLFEKLNFNYRFAEDFNYEIPYLKEEPHLFSYENGVINKKKIREINDLSDGEKAILNLIVATYDKKSDISTKLLLLDEYDATLNPSLINDYYTTIMEYYLEKGIIVILSTHSPITISLAPDCAKYYEIFRQIDKSPVIKEVNSDEYNELKLIQEYYNKIRNPSARLQQLEGENQKLKQALLAATTPIVITEGKTDWKHMKFAKDQLNNDSDFCFYEYESDKDMGDETLLRMLKDQSKIPNPNKKIFVFDNDNDKINKEVNNEDGSYKDWGNNVYSFSIPKPNIRDDESKISIEHYYSDEILKKEVILGDGITRRLYCGNDFNSVGLSTQLHKRCDSRKNCGPNKIRVLSGTGEEKVYDLESESDTVNYALTKDAFFNTVVQENSTNIDFTPFKLIFDIIEGIIK